MTRYLLDTNTISAIARDPLGLAAARAAAVDPAMLCTSVIVEAELLYGVTKQPDTRLAHRVAAALAVIPVLDFTREASAAYGPLRARLERDGQMIGGNDALIAAQCLAADCTLVTRNLREFSRVPDLRVENWIVTP
ncbi:MAG: PIN domain-containing protein [Hyphomonadaceae bacterium]|nr:PIN domain-containing protein [Hyphomonadaceae bacterium]